MANKFRGEMSLTLENKTYTLRPTFDALVEFEDKAGTTAYEAMKSLIDSTRAPAKAVAAAFWSGIKAGWTGPGFPPSYAEVGAMVQRAGIGGLLPSYLEYLRNALASDADLAAAEAQEAAGKPSTPGTP